VEGALRQPSDGNGPPPSVADATATSPSRGGSNLLALAVEAARARCTLGEISAALEDVFGRYDTVPRPVSGIYGGAYKGDPRWNQAEEGVDAVERRLGRKPRMLVAKMGQDGHDRGANLVASAFADLGFEVVPGPLFQTPEESARLAIERDVDVVGASSLAAGHRTLVPSLIDQLRELGRPDIKVVVGGVIPAQDYEMLREAGVQAIFGPGTNLVDAGGRSAEAARPQHASTGRSRGMIEEGQVPARELPFARSYDFFKHMAGISLLSLGGVFAFADGEGAEIERRQLIVVLVFIGLAGVTSLLMASSLAGQEVRPEEDAQVARRIRIAQIVVAFSLSGGLGAFIYNFTPVVLK
jgi:methylmalonyl-CoA mutase